MSSWANPKKSKNADAKYSVESKFVIVQMDVYCEWDETAPSYRVYVNDELFCERTYIWRDSYLTENLQIQAEPGEYTIRLESVPGHAANFRVENRRVKLGPGRWINNDALEILHAS